MDSGIVLCEIADEILDLEDPEHPSEFCCLKRRWRIKEFLAQHADVIVIAVQKSQKARTKRLCFRAIQQDTGQWSLVLRHEHTHIRIRPIELELAEILLPLVFNDYATSLEFEVARQELEHQQPLKTYVSTKLFDALYERHRQAADPNQETALVLPQRFQSRLRKYQERTVSWMLGREQRLTELPAKYTPLQAIDGQSRVFKHNYCLQFYPYEEELPKICLPPGGILADEMGLGKTVEFLAMLLLNPRPKETYRNEYWLRLLDDLGDELPLKRKRKEGRQDFCICLRKGGARMQCSKCGRWQHKHCMGTQNTADLPHLCPECWSELAKTREILVETGATFIVSPCAIKMQWFHEMKKHISPGLKVLLYRGLHAGSWVNPLELAQYDVVLTDYSILRNEIHHTADKKSDRQMRHQQLYMRPSCPLLMVNWWRVCLDEAQMVESNTSQAAEMVRLLPAVNRWAVTGTIDDLKPLLEFVGRTEACRPPEAWQTIDKAFQLNFKPEPLLEVLELSLWRTCKSKVEHELGIPPQTQVVHRLELSNVESLYYREEHQKCHQQFLEAVAKHTRYNADNSSSSLAAISPQLLRLILKPFLRIRQTCSVPVVINSNVASNCYLNPQELLARLKSNNEIECKTELRSWASSYNGLASIHFIREDFAEAIRYYKLVLKLAEDYNQENISVDSVLQIHAIFNLLQASDLAANPDQLSDQEKLNYQAQMKRLEWKYLEDNTAVLEAALNAYETKLKEVNQLEVENESNCVELLSAVVHHQPALQNAMWNKMLEEFMRQNIAADKIRDVDSMAGLVYYVDIWYQKLNKLKNTLLLEFVYLKEVMQSAWGSVKKGDGLPQKIINFIGSVTDCHLAVILEDKPYDKPEKPKKQRHCRLCKIRDSLNQFECLLFAKELEEEALAAEGLEKPSLEICLIKAIFAFVRLKPDFSEWQLECQNKLEVLASLQSLVKCQIKYWIEVEYMVKAFDELEMCRMRILLTDDPEKQSNYRIHHCQLEEQLQFNLSNLNEAQLNFTRLCGRLKYLKHLKEDATNKPCPICQTQDDLRYVMMVCGHFVCQHCLDTMRSRLDKGEGTKCPLCRQDSPQLYYSIRRGAHKSIAGDFSTKIAYIVELVLKIREADETEKVLIFSQWQAILMQIGRALHFNGIQFRSKCTNKEFEDFKKPESKITCLLMPISKGSKGLNLIEATHVFLVEPILNPGDELQAIGRIHRFGQTRPTKVHRFIVNGTIEENILSLITSADDTETLSTHWDLENMSLDSLKKLFILKDKE
ncbi:hypothetical protein KR059_004122 [Drosophila kikkawai]|nr:hypothetical protein KR059_004122 [Drosophila kikkawai]